MAPAHAIDKFGTFTFRIENIDLGHYSRVLRLPAFALSEQARARTRRTCSRAARPSGHGAARRGEKKSSRRGRSERSNGMSLHVALDMTSATST